MNKSKGTKSKKSTVSWGDPLNWGPRTEPVRHQMGCECGECQRLIKWAQGYQRYIAKVDR